MLRHVLWVGLLAGLVAGLATAVLQHFTTTPLIVAAERYEATGHGHGWLAPAPTTLAHNHGAAAAPGGTATDAGHDHGGGWMPEDGWQRTGVTTLATVLTAMGYALVLIAAMLVAGERITVRIALGWGAAAFAATGLATGLGLAPELPGSAAADLAARQVWWIGTAAATAAGLYGLFRLETLGARIGGAVLIAIPHLVGAPRPDKFESAVPAELAAHFASTSLALHAAMWIMVAAAIGVLWQRMARPV